MYPNNPILLVWLGSAYVDNGNFDEGVAVLKKAVSITKRKVTIALGVLGYAYGLMGKFSDAQDILSEALQREETGYFAPTFIAMIYTGMGNRDKAFEWLEHAVERKDPTIYPIKVMPPWRNLYSDPRWPELINKMGLEN